MHSPFVFDFILCVLNNKNDYQPPAEIEALRKSVLHHQKKIVVNDMGAGSRSNNTKEKTVAQIAKSALKPKKYAQLLFRLAKHYRPQTIIELGTSLGITTAYLATAHPHAKVITIEGSALIAEEAKTNFNQLRITNIEQRVGNFNSVLPSVIHQLPSVDLAYVDGNHRYQPTMDYFHQLLTTTNAHSILVFDDIHWSPEMEKAWQEIKQHPMVLCTVDIFFLGFVFFRNEFKVKQHFSIRF